MLGTFKKIPDELKALDRVKEWTRSCFSLAQDDVILVREMACDYPGCVPLETVVGFWTDGAVHHHFKIFKPVSEVVENDMPLAWMKEHFLVTEEYRCTCC